VNLLVDCLREYSIQIRINIISGNFNCSKINWSSHTCRNDCVNRKLFDYVVEGGYYISTLILLQLGCNILDRDGLTIVPFVPWHGAPRFRGPPATPKKIWIAGAHGSGPGIYLPPFWGGKQKKKGRHPQSFAYTPRP
jgi:hypothetical protein